MQYFTQSFLVRFFLPIYNILNEDGENANKHRPQTGTCIFLLEDTYILTRLRKGKTMLSEERIRYLSTKLSNDSENCIENLRNNIMLYTRQPDMTQSEFADLTGISTATLNNILYDKRKKDIQLSTVVSIAKALKISVDDLIGANCINPVTQESIAICKTLPEHSLYMVRYFIRHQQKIYSKLEWKKKYISIFTPKYLDSHLMTTNVTETLCINDLPESIRNKVYCGLKMPCNYYMPHFMQGEIILISADRDALNNELCIVTLDGYIYLVQKTRKIVNGKKIWEYISVINNNLVFRDKDIDDKIGYIVGFLNSDGTLGVR